MNKNLTLNLTISKKGIPCLWESGGGYTNTGSSQIVADELLQPKKPIYVRNRGSLACDDHALIPVKVGDVVIVADHHRGDFEITIWEITAIAGENATLEIASEFSDGEWENFKDCDLKLAASPAVNAAMAKATHYHCRQPYYIVGSVLV